MAKRTRRRNRRKQKQKQKQRKTRQRLRGGDYRINTETTMHGVPLSRKAGVSVVGRSGILSIEQARDYEQRMMMGERP